VRNRTTIIAIQGLIVICFFGVWEIGARIGMINPKWFSPPIDVLVRLVRETHAGTFLTHIWATTVETVAGFALGVIGGVALGIALGLTRRLRQILMPYLLMIYGIPRPALAPIFVLWFGIGLFSKIVLIVSLVYFVLLMYVLVGVRAVSPALLRFAQTTGASGSQIVSKIMIPSVMPYIFAGMKLGIGLAIVGAVVGEIIASRLGLGHYIYQAAQRGDTQGVYVGLAALGIMSFVLVFGMEWLDRRLFHWRQEVTL
jgi:NitT/TauT family transport system permease protein